MLELPQRSAWTGRAGLGGSTQSEGLAQRPVSSWRGPLSIVNLRLDPSDAEAAGAVARVLGLGLPLAACTTCGDDRLRMVWAGPDDWFLIGPAGQAEDWIAKLTAELSGRHCALTDVSSGYRVLQLGGAAARELLAQGCPLDLHPRVFRPGMSAGTVFFKASIWLWQTDDTPRFELLVRSSFQGYVQLLVERAGAGCGGA